MNRSLPSYLSPHQGRKLQVWRTQPRRSQQLLYESRPDIPLASTTLRSIYPYVHGARPAARLWFLPVRSVEGRGPYYIMHDHRHSSSLYKHDQAPGPFTMPIPIEYSDHHALHHLYEESSKATQTQVLTGSVRLNKPVSLGHHLE